MTAPTLAEVGAAAVLVLLGVLSARFVASYRTLVRLRQRVREAWAEVDSRLRRRYDLIAGILDATREALEDEPALVEAVAKARAAAIEARGVRELAVAEGALAAALGRLLAAAAARPALASCLAFRQRRWDLAALDDEIAAARRRYDPHVLRYDDKILLPPGNVVAAAFGFEPEEVFDVEVEAAVEDEARVGVGIDVDVARSGAQGGI